MSQGSLTLKIGMKSMMMIGKKNLQRKNKLIITKTIHNQNQIQMIKKMIPKYRGRNLAVKNIKYQS